MASAEEHLRTDVGNIIAQLLFQIAGLKAELDRLQKEATAHDGQAVRQS